MRMINTSGGQDGDAGNAAPRWRARPRGSTTPGSESHTVSSYELRETGALVERTLQAPARVRVGLVGAYVNGRDLSLVRTVKRMTGRVTLAGVSALATAAALVREDGPRGIDVDPTDRRPSPRSARGHHQASLFAHDEIAEVIEAQRRLGLSVVRAPGQHVRGGDVAALRAAFTRQLPEDVVRMVILESTWLRRHLRPLLEEVAGCAGPLAFVLAASMDPMEPRGSVRGLLRLLDVARAGGRRVELLRTDTTGIAFAAYGGSLAAIGVRASLRHHALTMKRAQQEEYQARQTSSLVFLPSLVSWHRGAKLAALGPLVAQGPLTAPGLIDCGCPPCSGRSLLRFAQEWPPSLIPQEVADDASRHDVACWAELAGRVLAADDPARVWSQVCRAAVRTVGELQSRHRVAALTLPRSLDAWANHDGPEPVRRPGRLVIPGSGASPGGAAGPGEACGEDPGRTA